MQEEEKPRLSRTLSKRFQKQKEESEDVANVDEKPKLLRTLSKRFSKKNEDDGTDLPAAEEKPKLIRTLSQRFKKDDEKSKLKLRFDIRVVRITKCQINNTTVFLGWKRSATVAGDTRRAVVTDCCAKFGDVISVDAVLSKPIGEEAFRPSLISMELKEDKLVRKGTGKAKWHVLGRGSFDLATYHAAEKALCIIPLTKKKANIQLELEITAVWQHLDGQKFEIVAPSEEVSKVPDGKKRVELIGTAKYAVSRDDSDVECYTEEEIDYNLSEIESDDEYTPKFQTMGSLLSNLSGGVASAPVVVPQEISSSDDDEDPFVPDDDLQQTNSVNESNPFASPASKETLTSAVADASNPFASASVDVAPEEKKSLFKRKPKKIETAVVSVAEAPKAVRKEQVIMVMAPKEGCEQCESYSKELDYLHKTLAAQQMEIGQIKTNEKRLNLKLLASDAAGKARSSAAASPEIESLERQVEYSDMLERNVFLSNYDFNSNHEPVSALKLFDDFINLGIFEDYVFIGRFFESISMFCSQPKIGNLVVEYWISSGVFLLQIQRNAKKRLSVEASHPLIQFEHSLQELIVNLVTRIFTNTLKRIEALLVQSLQTRYQAEHYFRPEELAMGEIIAHFSQLLKEFRENYWSSALIEIFFTFCVDLIDRFLAEKIMGSPEYCSLAHGVKIKMEQSFLSNWLLKNKETEGLVNRLDHILDCANLLIMSKGSGAQNVASSCSSLNLCQIHKILSQYQPEKVNAPSTPSAATSGDSAPSSPFPVIPAGMSKSSQKIVQKLEGSNFLNVQESDRVDPALLKRLEADDAFGDGALGIVDSFEDNVLILKQHLVNVE